VRIPLRSRLVTQDNSVSVLHQRINNFTDIIINKQLHHKTRFKVSSRSTHIVTEQRFTTEL